MDAFVPYGGLHAVALAVCLPAIAAPALIGRALEHIGRSSCAARWRRSLFVIGLPTRRGGIGTGSFAHRPAAAGVRLQRADRAAGAAERLAFRTRDFVFLDRALTLQAFIQPALTAGPAALVFWAFWMAHTRSRPAQSRPRRAGLSPLLERSGRALIVSACYVALGVPINLWLGSNYGYLGNPAAVSEFRPLCMRWDPGRSVRSSWLRSSAWLRRRAAALAYPRPAAKARTSKHPQPAHYRFYLKR